MTTATGLGFKIGELYRCTCSDSCYYVQDMVVEFIRDDGSDCPWFKYSSGPVAEYQTGNGNIAITLDHLVPMEPIKTSSNKPLLILYIQQQYPDDKVLKALVESI